MINNDNLFILFKICCHLYICDSLYVKNVFDIIKTKSDNEKFNEFLTYFEEVNINLYNIKQWNYNKNYEHITNNVCESYNSKLNNLFNKKPTFFKLVYENRIEEAFIMNSYNQRYAGLLGHEVRRKTRTEYFIDSINQYIEEIEEMSSNPRDEKNLICNKWFECLQSLRI